MCTIKEEFDSDNAVKYGLYETIKNNVKYKEYRQDDTEKYLGKAFQNLECYRLCLLKDSSSWGVKKIDDAIENCLRASESFERLRTRRMFYCRREDAQKYIERFMLEDKDGHPEVVTLLYLDTTIATLEVLINGWRNMMYRLSILGGVKERKAVGGLTTCERKDFLPKFSSLNIQSEDGDKGLDRNIDKKSEPKKVKEKSKRTEPAEKARRTKDHHGAKYEGGDNVRKRKRGMRG